MSSRDYGLVIGIGDYEFYPELEAAIKDANDVYEWLQGAGLQRVEKVIVEGETGRPVKTEIDNALFNVLEAADEGSRRLWVYFTGHGSAATLRHVMVLMADCSERHPRRAVNAPKYHDAVATYAKFTEQIFLYDCCRGYDRRHKGEGPDFLDDAKLSDRSELVKQIIGYSSHWKSESYESEYNERVRGLFTAALLAGLKGSAATLHSDGWVVTPTTLRQYVKERVRKESADLGGPQEPLMQIDDGAENFVLSRVDSPPGAVTVEVEAPGEQDVTLRDTNLNKQTHDLTDGRVSFPARPGKYSLETYPSRYQPPPDGALWVWPGENKLVSSVSKPTERAATLVVEAADPTAVVEIADAEGGFIARGSGSVCRELAAGVYTARLRRRLDSEERLVWLEDKDETVRFEPPQRPPLGALADAVPAALGGLDFIAAPRGQARVILVGAVAARLALPGDDELRIDPSTEAVAADATPGYATLEHDVHELGRRAQPVPLVQGWETQVFLAGPKEPGPRVKLYLRPYGSGYDPRRLAEYAAIDAALDGLFRGEVVLDEAARKALESGDGLNPLLALIAAYAAVAQGDEALASLACDRLEGVLADAPDVLVLQALLGRARRPVTEPPLLGVATERLMDLGDPELVPKGSPLHSISLQLRSGGAWTRWDVRPADASDLRALERDTALLNAGGHHSAEEIARLLGLPQSLVPKPDFRTKLWARWTRWRAGLRRSTAYLPVWLRTAPRRAWNRFLAYERRDALERVPPPRSARSPGGDLRPDERSSRVRADCAGWEPPDEHWKCGSWERRLDELQDRRWRDFSWLTARALLDSVNDAIAKRIHDLVDPERARWLAAQRAAGVLERFPDLVIQEEGARRCLLVGDPGEADPSQYAVATAVDGLERTEGCESDLMVVLSDVIYPAGDVNDYVNGFYEAYRDYRKPIYAIPGNHDWYDGLNGFMFHFCGAEALPPTIYRKSSYSTPERVARWLWRRADRPKRPLLGGYRYRQDPKWRPRQPGPYWAMDIAGGVRLIGIDTGIGGTLDREQGEWLLRMSRTPCPKVLLTGKPIWVGGEYHPCPIDWGRAGPPEPFCETVDDIVRDPRFQYVAAIGGDTHNYQRQSVTVGSGETRRTIEYVVAGGSGAYMSATHPIGRIGTPPSMVDEEQFRCYPTRGDSLAYYARWYGKRLVGAVRLMLAAIVLGAVGTFAWRELGELPDHGLGRVMLAALAGTLGIPLAVVAVSTAAHRAFPRGYRTVGVVLALAALAAGAALGAVALADRHDWAWQAALIGVAVAAIPLVVALAGYYGFATEAELRQDLLVSALVVVVAGLYLADLSSWQGVLSAVALGLLATALLLRIIASVRPKLGASRAIERLRRVPRLYLPAVFGGGTLAAAIVVARFWDAWAVKAAVAAVLALLIAVPVLLLLLVVLPGARWVLVDLAQKELLDADRALGYLYDRGIVETLPQKLAPGRPARVKDYDQRTARICEFLLPGTRGPRKWLTSAVSQIGNADVPPMFKSFVTVEVTDKSELVIECRGVTGWAQHEPAPTFEDRVTIPLR